MSYQFLIGSKFLISFWNVEQNTQSGHISIPIFVYSDIVAVVLDGDDSHDIRSVLRIWVWAILVGQHQTGIGLVNLKLSEKYTWLRSQFILTFFNQKKKLDRKNPMDVVDHGKLDGGHETIT